jgi:hypothetical protein
MSDGSNSHNIGGKKNVGVWARSMTSLVGSMTISPMLRRMGISIMVQEALGEVTTMRPQVWEAGYWAVTFPGAMILAPPQTSTSASV